MTSDDKTIHFREVQRFNRIGLWIMIIFVSGFVLFGTVQEILYGIETGTDPDTHIGIIILGLVIGLGIPSVFSTIKLITEVRNDGVYLMFFPFQLKFQPLSFDDIVNFKVREFNPQKEFGGWGIKYGESGKALTMNGNYGVQVDLHDRSEVMIGSRKPQELVIAIEKAKSVLS